ncbi:MAG: hypothetical protein MK135_05745 [Polyangiaceae bacterium]|nr:hypothetical protein [Polyangiaceae bacterium]
MGASEKRDRVAAFTDWLMSKAFSVNLKSIYLAGHSRGACSALRMAARINQEHPEIPIIVHSFDGVCNADNSTNHPLALEHLERSLEELSCPAGPRYNGHECIDPICTVSGSIFDSVHCYLPTPPGTNAFQYQGGKYWPPLPGNDCPLGNYDGANCLVVPSNYDHFVYDGGSTTQFQQTETADQTSPTTERAVSRPQLATRSLQLASAEVGLTSRHPPIARSPTQATTGRTVSWASFDVANCYIGKMSPG